MVKIIKKNRCMPCEYDLQSTEMYCPICGKSRQQINREWKAKLPEIMEDLKNVEKCGHCGKYKKIGDLFTFCPYCGKKY